MSGCPGGRGLGGSGESSPPPLCAYDTPLSYELVCALSTSAGGKNHLISSVKFKQFLHILDEFGLRRWSAVRKSPNFLGRIQSK